MAPTIARNQPPGDLDAVPGPTRDFHRRAMKKVSQGPHPATLGAELATHPGIVDLPSGCLRPARLTGDTAVCRTFDERGDTALKVVRISARPAAHRHRSGELPVSDSLPRAHRLGVQRVIRSPHPSKEHTDAAGRRAADRDVECWANFPVVARGTAIGTPMLPTQTAPLERHDA
ncbi:hypothetical protein ACRDNQ_18225 [Palleronia sp. KMU-117]|uniref:hypothetical protein n=1 Tax=Palleronia sp. KMU-117 TaxID=3434108 RepID=UPI003D704533